MSLAGQGGRVSGSGGELALARGELFAASLTLIKRFGAGAGAVYSMIRR